MCDNLGCHKYIWDFDNDTVRFVKTLRPTPGEIYGMCVIREDNGGILFVVQDARDLLIRYRIYDLDLVGCLSHSIFMNFTLGREEERSPCGFSSIE